LPKRALKRRADGRYLCWYKGITFYGHTSDEALAAREEYKQRLKAGLREETLGITFQEYASNWIITYKADVSIKTYNGYARYLNIACASIGDVRMRDITASDIKQLYQAQRGKSYSFMHKYTMIIKSIFVSAVDDGVILRNPCSRVSPPSSENGTHRALEPWERDLVASMVGKHDFSAAAMLMLYAGLRRGEMLAFNIDRDADFERGVLHVREAIVFDNNRPVLTDPKTDAGIRAIPLFAPLRAALEGKHGLVLPARDGGYMTKTGFRRKWNSYLRLLGELQNGGHNRRWYGQTAEDRQLITGGGQLPP